jgi:tetratricopeptide (TPR) repeat protein
MTATPEPHQEGADPLLTRVADLYYAGAWTEAERICETILARDPRHSHTLVTWGELALLRGDLPAARERLRRAARTPLADFVLQLRLIQSMARAGDWEALESARRFWVESLRRNSRNYNDLYALGLASEALGRTDEAISAYEAACAIVPSNGGPQTYRGVLLLRRAWGAPLPSPPEKRQPTDARGRISMTTLGRMGRFANQIFQYGFLRLYGGIHGLQVEVPDWVGRWLFDLDDPYPGAPLRPLNENRDLMGGFLGERSTPLLANYDLQGHLQCHTRHFRPHQAMLRTLFRPGERLRPMMDRALARLRERGRTVVAIHLRRGDYTGGELFWPAPTSWYLDWLRETWRELDAPVLYVASDDTDIRRAFSEFAPVTAVDLGETLPGAEMYPDFHILASADRLAVSNSSFSVAAAMLNEIGARYVRPEPRLRRLVPFDPWDTDVLLRAPAPEKPG